MIWFIMIATGLFTFATRFIMLSNGINNRPPPWLVDALGFELIPAPSGDDGGASQGGGAQSGLECGICYSCVNPKS